MHARQKKCYSWLIESYKALLQSKAIYSRAIILRELSECVLFVLCNPDAVYFTADARCRHSKVKILRSKKQRLILLKCLATTHSYDWKLYVS